MLAYILLKPACIQLKSPNNFLSSSPSWKGISVLIKLFKQGRVSQSPSPGRWRSLVPSHLRERWRSGEKWQEGGTAEVILPPKETHQRTASKVCVRAGEMNSHVWIQSFTHPHYRVKQEHFQHILTISNKKGNKIVATSWCHSLDKDLPSGCADNAPQATEISSPNSFWASWIDLLSLLVLAVNSQVSGKVHPAGTDRIWHHPIISASRSEGAATSVSTNEELWRSSEKTSATPRGR